MSFLKRLFPPSSRTPASLIVAAEQQVLESQVQALRLELTNREETISRLKSEIDHLRARQDSLADERSAALMESLMSELAAPTAQIITQADLLVNQGKPVQAHDILTVARRIVRVLERRGLVLEGSPGEQAQFDPAVHQPLTAGVNPQPGQPVTIRFAGVRYGSKMLLKAMID